MAPGADDPPKLVKEAFYVTVGLGVIVFQRAQAKRRELQKRFDGRLKTIQERIAAGRPPA